MTTETNTPRGEGWTVLAVDTSTATLAVAIVRNGTALGAVQSHAERNHSVLVVPEIRQLMQSCGVSQDQLDAIAVGQGPGSYTGVRIAATVGKTLAWAWNKPLIGVSSLEALAWHAWEMAQADGSLHPAGRKQVWIIPALDARRGQVYTARFAADTGGAWKRLDADGIRMAGEWAGRMRREASEAGDVAALLYAGDVAAHAAHFNEPASGIQVLAATTDMSAAAVGQLAAVRWQQGARDDTHAFVPNYTQLAEAEAKRLAAAQGD